MAKELGRASESLEWSKKAKLALPVTNRNMNHSSCTGLLRNYLDYTRLVNAGSSDAAAELAGKMKSCVAAQLSKTHDFYEFCSPQEDSGDGITDYFPDSIIAKLLIEENVK